ncbi:MAG: Rrf2 family transcriptional regulator [Elusimicrobiota bacterium]|jgi:Rrf2 family protein|nr:Rrf2 family transcriptional regulator [Elusimicrobiota bacterium]
MRLSTKARYGLSCMLFMGKNYNLKEFITISTLSERLSISKIYLEQVFVLLKRAGLVIAAKGAQGGYFLSKTPAEINVFDILYAAENTLFEKNIKVKITDENIIEKVLQTNVYNKFDESVKDLLSQMKLSDLISEVEKQEAEQGYMYHL